MSKYFKGDDLRKVKPNQLVEMGGLYCVATGKKGFGGTFQVKMIIDDNNYYDILFAIQDVDTKELYIING